MTRPADTMDPLERVVLAEAEPLQLGAARLSPSTRELIWPGGRAVLEPRVTQTLVALARAQGRVVSRDALVGSCWDGRFVGDDAINRALSQARKAGREAGDAFTIETIPRVGYRLSVNGPSAQPVESRPAGLGRRRRAVLAGAACVTGAAALAAVGWLASRPMLAGKAKPPPEVVDLVRKAREANAVATAGQYAQAVAYLEQAIAVSPDYADAWGALSLSYAGLRFSTPPDQRAALAGRQRAAAERALALDPANAEGNAGLALSVYQLGAWLEADRAFRKALATDPSNGPVKLHYARVLSDVGRNREALAMVRSSGPGGPNTARSAGLMGELLWSVGEESQAVAWMEDADKRWPRHTAIWFPLLFMHAFSGRTRQVDAMVADVARRPPGIMPDNFDAWRLVSRAVETQAPRDREAALAMHRELANRGAALAGNAIGVMASLGALDEAFVRLRAFYLGEGDDAPLRAYSETQDGYLPRANRLTRYLFRPDAFALHPDPRFATFCADVGLEAYWRQTRSQPDYRIKRA